MKRGVVVPLEAGIVRRICRLLDGTEDCWYIKVHGSGYGRVGVPDIVGCYRGFFFAIEVKRPGGAHPVSAAQRRELTGVQLAGGSAIVAHSTLEVEEMLASIRSYARD